MGLIARLFGSASEIEPSSVESLLAGLLVPAEVTEKAYRLIRDTLVFTDRRLIVVNRQGLTGRKLEFHSFPYRSITHFSVEAAGRFDLEAELKIWMSGQAMPRQFTFDRQVNIREVQGALARYVLR